MKDKVTVVKTDAGVVYYADGSFGRLWNGSVRMEHIHHPESCRKTYEEMLARRVDG